MDPIRCKTLVKELDMRYKMFPHIAIRLESKWKNPQTRDYLKTLLVKDRSNRSGFDIDTYKTIFHLYLIHVKDVENLDNLLVIDEPNVHIS